MTEAGLQIPAELGLAVVFGLPGKKTQAASETLQIIARSAIADCSIVLLNSISDWNIACSVGKPFIGISQYPSPQFRMHIAAMAAPVLVIVEEPMSAVAQLASDLESDVSTVRAVSASYSCLAGLMAVDEAELQLSNVRNVRAFLVRLAEMNGINIRGPDVGLIEQNAYLLTCKMLAEDVEAKASDGRMQDNWASARDVLPHYELQKDDNIVRCDWPGNMFLLGDAPDTRMVGSIDLSGPARCLLYGPYLHLPPGNWVADLIVEIGEYDANQVFSVEVVCSEVIARGSFSLQSVGLFEIRMEFIHYDPHVPLEVRLFLDVGTIVGSIESFSVRLARTGDALSN